MGREIGVNASVVGLPWVEFPPSRAGTGSCEVQILASITNWVAGFAALFFFAIKVAIKSAIKICQKPTFYGIL